MMHKFRLIIPRQYETNLDSILEYVKRIAQIISYDSSFFPRGNRDEAIWSLGTSNDWKLELISDRTFELRYRYGGGKQEEMQALKTTLMWLMNLEDGDIDSTNAK